MGKRLFQEVYVSQSRTDELGLPGLVVVSEADDRDTVDFTYHAVHKSYFDKDKMKCPFCSGTNTAETKIRPRKFKDILTSGEKKGKVIDLVFHQRFFRCDDCKGRIFREDIDFAEEGCRYTNRLSDLLAEGTLTRTYEKVCQEYGVPASKASVGVIMRRRLRIRREQMPPLKTPDSLIIFVAYYFSDAYPIVLGLYGREVRLIDVLSGSDEATYAVFFQELDRDEVKRVYIDPDEQLHMAAAAAFTDAEIMLAPTNPKKAGSKKEKLSPLEEIIQRINEEFMGEFTEADRVIVETLYNKMKKDENVQKAAQTDDRQVYDRCVFPGIFDETAMAAYAENTEAYRQLFLDAKKYHAVQAALADKLYRELHP